MWELVISTRALRDPASAPLHMPWARATRERVRGLDLLPLFALVPAPRLPARLRHAAAGVAARELRGRARRGARGAGRARALRGRRARRGGHGRGARRAVPAHAAARGRAARRRARRLLGGRARAALGARPRAARGRRAAPRPPAHRGRALEVLADLHPDVRWRDEGLEVAVAYDTTVPLAGRGMLLVPTAFPARASAITSSFWQPTVMYPARGVGLLWEPGGARPLGGAQRGPGPRPRGGPAGARRAAHDRRGRPPRRDHAGRRLAAPHRAARRRPRHLGAPRAQRPLRAQPARRPARRLEVAGLDPHRQQQVEQLLRLRRRRAARSRSARR